MDSLSAVITDADQPDLTVRSANALLAEGVPAGRIVIVENGSSDESWQEIRPALPGCVFVRINPNIGYARATNAGAAALPGDAYLLVNNDAFVHRAGSVDSLVRALDRPEVGIVVPRLLNADLTLQPSVGPHTTPLVALVRASGMSRFVPDRWQPSWSTHWSHDRSRTVQAAVGAVMLVRGRVWDELGGLREDAFMYAEDLDICWRARERGWSTWFEADAEFIHLGGASSSRVWSDRQRSERVGRAEAAMLRAHLSSARAEATIAIMRAGLAARVAWFRVVRNADAAESCRGSYDGLGSSRAPESDRVPTAEIDVVHPD